MIGRRLRPEELLDHAEHSIREFSNAAFERLHPAARLKKQRGR
jgi:hypothetical protein